jgi:hypothetical protein
MAINKNPSAEAEGFFIQEPVSLKTKNLLTIDGRQMVVR